MAPDPVGEAVALHDRALSAWDECRYPLAADLCRRALELLEAHAGAGSPDVANVLTLLGGAQDELGAHGEAEAHHRRAAGIMGALPSQPDVLLRLRVQAALGLAGNLRRQGRYAEAERVYLAACDDAAATWTALEMVPLHNELGVLYKFAGRFDDAQARYAIVRAVLEDAYGAGHPVLGAVWHNLAGLAHSRGDLAEGEAYARRSLALHRAAFPPGHPAVVADEAHLAALLQARGNHAEAEPLLRRAIGYFTDLHGPDHVDVLTNLHNLAAVLAGSGDPAGAEELYRRALDGKRRTFGPDHPELALTLNNLAALTAGRGGHAAARAMAAEAHRILAPRVAADHPVLRSVAGFLETVRTAR
ncbi:tetratricopeptide repeat protein [Dactylosporangium sp. NBC_01737]|uniref:tetratricopeptide repeat protein n=1 Tax=Dactylosporangium sp. NBC_01737 TaxID=2975959 RepID=UPI002E13367C|nr:tetratricopeptide repeat protein [Dactylosporangium sp. NBC_01737]